MAILLFFLLPPLITGIEFLVFLYTKKKPMNGPIGFLLDMITLIAFPFLYLILEQGFHLFKYYQFSNTLNILAIIIVVFSIAGYFALQLVNDLLNDTQKTIILTILGIGILLNGIMIYQQYSFLNLFNVPIILLFIMRITQTARSMFSEKEIHVSKAK